MITPSRRTVLAGLAGLAGLSAVPRLMGAEITAGAWRGTEVDFGFSTVARVLAPSSGCAPALFICGAPGAPGARGVQRGGAGPLAQQCVAAGFTAVTIDAAAARGVADDAWLAGAARWVKDNQSSGRLTPGQVFLGGEGQGAAGAFAWAADFRRALGTTRLRAVVGLNASLGTAGLGTAGLGTAGLGTGISAARARAREIAALTRGDETSIVLISDGGADDSLALGRELAALNAPFELHLFARPEPGLPADAMSMAQMQRSLHQPTA